MSMMSCYEWMKEGIVPFIIIERKTHFTDIKGADVNLYTYIEYWTLVYRFTSVPFILLISNSQTASAPLFTPLTTVWYFVDN